MEFALRVQFSLLQKIRSETFNLGFA